MTDPAPDLAALRERLERHRGVRAYYISVRHDDVFAVLALIDTLQEYVDANEALLHGEDLRGDRQFTEAQDRYGAARRTLCLSVSPAGKE